MSPISRLTRFISIVFLLGGCAADRWDTALRGPVGQIDQRIHRDLREAYKSMDLDQILSFYSLQMPPGWSVRDHPVAKHKRSILNRFDRIEHAWVSIRPPAKFDKPEKGLATIFTRTTLQGPGPEGYLQAVVDATLLVKATESNATILAEEVHQTKYVAHRERTFTEVTLDAGITMVHQARGSNINSRIVAGVAPGPGAACGDVHGDGFEDLYLVNGDRDRLYRNRGDGTFDDVTEEAGLGDNDGDGQGAVFADFDNDGDADLFVTNISRPNQLFMNAGNGTFIEVTDRAGLTYAPYSRSISVFDYDNDGYLDIYVLGGGDFWKNVPSPVYQARNGTPCRLFRNNGNWTFTDVTRQAGVGDTGWGQAVAASDYDNDGDQDIYIANDFGFNCLYQNQSDGTFLDVAGEVGAIDRGAGMGCDWGDFNNDGHMDLFVSNLFTNSAWLFRHPDYPLPGLWFENWLFKDEVIRIQNDMVRGSTMLLNNGDGTFTDVSDDLDLRDTPQWAWGSYFFDYDNDADVDIYIANGMLSGESKKDL
ncbi:MAG: VCBS repeat-containing protein [Phycisphaerales bacterium]|nr:MAG: VCBS repeat-containing protein [Phycisphaerales bacterium]